MGEDLLLKKQKSLSTEGLEYSFVGLSSSTIDIVDANINLIWVMANFDKTVKPRDIIINAQEIFKNNELKLKDIFWKEHCASSLRELMDSHFFANCKRFLICIPERGNSEEERKICESLQRLKEFLNNFGHFKKSTLALAKEILGDDSLKEVNEQEFDKLCVNFIFQLESFFKYKKR